MDILRKSLAPIIDDAWEEIECEARRVLVASLSSRRIVDVKGPHGWDFSAVNLGRVAVDDHPEVEGVRYGIRRVLPLVEIRVPFSLDIWELDNVARGAEDPDLSSVVEAAQSAAHFEELAVYRGFDKAAIRGLCQAVEHDPLPLGTDAASYPQKVARAVTVLQDEGVEGPYTLVLGPEPFKNLASVSGTYPPRKEIVNVIGGSVVYSPVLDGGFLVSTRGGDFELTLGQDFSIGYEGDDGNNVRLFLTESFTFRVLGPEAVFHLPAGG